MAKCYAILESLYIKQQVDGTIKLKPVDNDRLLGMVVFDNEEAAIDMVKDFQKDSIEVTDEEIIKRLPNVDELAGRLKYYSISQMRNTVVTYKVMAISILKSKPMIK
jgi:hypothetical protein